MADLKARLMICTRRELIERFGGHGCRMSTLKAMRKEEMVDFLIEFFGTEYPPPPLDPAAARDVAAVNEKRMRGIYEELFG